MQNGTEPPESVTIERVCGVNTVRVEGYTDSKGRFSMQLGQNLASMGDASSGLLADPNTTSGNRSAESSNTGGMMSDPSLFGCDLRARLPGYRSSTLSLSNRRALDPPEIGTIILYGAADVSGLTVSITDSLASKEARKAYESGLKSAKKEKFAQAEKEFRQAILLFPKYSSAWLELGKSLVAQSKRAEAREAYNKALESDAKFVYPYEQLYELSFEEEKWPELLEYTGKVIRLNPIEFPNAFYFNGVANFQLRNFPAAEVSLRRALEMGGPRRNTKVMYVLGLVLIQTHDYAGAAESLRAFVKASPLDPQIRKASDLIAQLNQLIAQQ